MVELIFIFFLDLLKAVIKVRKKQIPRKTGLVLISRKVPEILVFFSDHPQLQNLTQPWSNRTCPGSTTTLATRVYTSKVGFVFEIGQRHTSDKV